MPEPASTPPQEQSLVNSKFDVPSISLLVSCRFKHHSSFSLHPVTAGVQKKDKVTFLTLPQEVRDQIFDIVIEITGIHVSTHRGVSAQTDFHSTVATRGFQGNKHLLAINSQLRNELLARTTVRDGTTKPEYIVKDLYGLFKPALTFYSNPYIHEVAWNTFATDTFHQQNVQHLVIRVPTWYLEDLHSNNLRRLRYFRDLKTVVLIVYDDNGRRNSPYRQQVRETIVEQLQKAMLVMVDSWPLAAANMRPSVPTFELIEPNPLAYHLFST
jgi:hypothetical protein